MSLEWTTHGWGRNRRRKRSSSFIHTLLIHLHTVALSWLPAAKMRSRKRRRMHACLCVRTHDMSQRSRLGWENEKDCVFNIPVMSATLPPPEGGLTSGSSACSWKGDLFAIVPRGCGGRSWSAEADMVAGSESVLFVGDLECEAAFVSTASHFPNPPRHEVSNFHCHFMDFVRNRIVGRGYYAYDGHKTRLCFT